MKILECSSRGDKRFSAFYANVTVFGRTTNIERHYQSCKRFNDENIKKAKGQTPDYIFVNGVRLDVKYLTPYYKLLWVKYLDENLELVIYAAQFDDYNDMFKGKSINCQADVIGQYVKQGRDSILQEEFVEEFIEILSNEYRNLTPEEELAYAKGLKKLSSPTGRKLEL